MPVKIHNKEYFTVAERLNELNKNVDGNYTLTTDMVYFRDGMVVFKAILQIEDNTFVGHAMEKESASMINKTSFVECAETSAIGRALASAGYMGTEFASADEFATPNQIKYIKSLCQERGIDDSKYSFDEMTKNEASGIIQEVMDTKKVTKKDDAADVPF